MLDKHVAQRMRQRRTLMGLSLTDLAAASGVRYQQVHKYETGLNRITVGHLYAVAAALGADVTYFFEDIASPDMAQPRRLKRRQLDLMQAFTKIRSPAHQVAFYEIVRVVAETEIDTAAE
jgi:transcriptional regulator with XRE-family HTH domain